MKSAPPEQKVPDVSKVRQILVVEDEQAIREMVAYALRRAGLEVSEAASSQDARVRLADQRPDLMLVDWMLPDMSGLELTRLVKRDPGTRDVPIIMLTARAAEGDKVAGLDGGADDYMTKPFSPRELLARINAVLRRSGAAEADDRLQLAGLSMDRASHRVSRDDREVTLGPTEYRMLEFFMQNPERVYSRSQLLDRVWGGNVYIEERTIDVHIRRLRKALEDVELDHLIQTVRGSGYRFSAREQAG
jgi:two-component system, OmpR family, phosphate regulon response regulator PhoB